MNYFSGGYEGFLTAKVKADLPGMPAGTELAGIELDCDQTGLGNYAYSWSRCETG